MYRWLLQGPDFSLQLVLLWLYLGKIISLYLFLFGVSERKTEIKRGVFSTRIKDVLFSESSVKIFLGYNFKTLSKRSLPLNNYHPTTPYKPYLLSSLPHNPGSISVLWYTQITRLKEEQTKSSRYQLLRTHSLPMISSYNLSTIHSGRRNVLVGFPCDVQISWNRHNLIEVPVCHPTLYLYISKSF